MQPYVEPCRSHMTPDGIIALLRDAPALQLSGGLEVIDLDLRVIEDISDDLAGGSISRNSYADLHSSASLAITRELAWGADLIRPYIVVSDGLVSARFNLGAYHLSTPSTNLAERPVTYAVDGYDMLLRLHQNVGDSYSIAAGDSYLDRVAQILTLVGYRRFVIDQSAAGTVAPTSRAWAFDEQITWLRIVNDMLAAVGYQGVWADWDGQLRCEPYLPPADREAEWYYSDDAATTMLGTDRVVEHDYFQTPNKWVFYRNNLADEAAPVEGAGMFTYTNQSLGETSVDARNGLTIVKPVGVEAADQAALVAQAWITISADMQVPITLPVKTSPNPLHWHFDRLYLTDRDGVGYADVMCTAWTLTLPPDTSDMQQSWTVIASGGRQTSAAGEEGQDAVPPPAGTPKTSALADTFRSLDAGRWPTTGGASAVGWRGRLTLPAVGSTAILSTGAVKYDLTSSTLHVQVQRLPSLAGASCYLMARINGSNLALVGMESGNLLMREVAGGVVSDTTLTFDRFAHRWWRLRHDGTNLLWETSINGSTWTTRRSKATTLNLTSVEVVIEGLWLSTAGAANRFEVSHLNADPVTPL